MPGVLNPQYRLGVGALAGLLILILVAVTAALIVRTEPASLLLARHRWHRSRSAYETALAIQRDDAEAAVVAGQGWRDLVQAQAGPSAESEE